nr:MAG TPA_asm: hypothetical protein [Caudoviricetes sp.]
MGFRAFPPRVCFGAGMRVTAARNHREPPLAPGFSRGLFILCVVVIATLGLKSKHTQ